MEIGTMSAKFLPAIVAGLLLGTTALASAQTLVYPQYRYNYGYNGYTPVYPPTVTFGFGVVPGAYYAPGITTMLLPTSAPATMVGTMPAGTAGKSESNFHL
jgi:hypothetical protein